MPWRLDCVLDAYALTENHDSGVSKDFQAAYAKPMQNWTESDGQVELLGELKSRLERRMKDESPSSRAILHHVRSRLMTLLWLFELGLSKLH